MGLKTMSLTAAATMNVTGGSALAFADNGVSIPNGIQIIVPADTDYQTRRVATIKYRPPTIDSKTGAYSKDKKSICLTLPIVLADGRVVFNTLRVERELHPSVSTATAVELNKLGAQLLIDTDTDAFWATGSLS